MDKHLKPKTQQPIVLIGYSGHAYVAADIATKSNFSLVGYLDQSPKENNPFNLPYLGTENAESVSSILKESQYFVAIGNNLIRGKVTESLISRTGYLPATIIHPHAIIGIGVNIKHGCMIGPGAIINALAQLNKGVICNSGAIIEHECIIGEYAHIAPGAVLAGNVTIGAYTFIGANAVIKQGITIGKNVVVGAGTVIIRDIPDQVTVVGNPSKIIT